MKYYDKFRRHYDKQYLLSKKIMDLGMGVIYLAVGFFVLLGSFWGIQLSFPTPPFNYFFGVLIIVYGIFRLYRALQNKAI